MKNQLLLVDNYRILIGRLRLFWFVRILRRLKTIDSEDAFAVTVKHNLKGLKVFRQKRIVRLLYPLSVIETLDKKTAKVLVIGPRNENDLFLLWGLGFDRKNVIGMDLITYSKYIRLGDMHAMEYGDNEFDAVVVGWTLSYSRSPEKMASELLRVTKDNGVIAIGVAYSELANEDLKGAMGYSIAEDGYARINSTTAIMDLFGDAKKEVFFENNAPKKLSKTSVEKHLPDASYVGVCFSIKK